MILQEKKEPHPETDLSPFGPPSRDPYIGALVIVRLPLDPNLIGAPLVLVPAFVVAVDVPSQTGSVTAKTFTPSVPLQIAPGVTVHVANAPDVPGVQYSRHMVDRSWCWPEENSHVGPLYRRDNVAPD